MDNEMMERCNEEILKLIQGYNTLGLRAPTREIVATCITAMREPTEKMLALGPEVQCWPEVIDAIIGDE